MHRFYVNSTAQPDIFSLPEEDARHALRVLRLEPGDEVEGICQGQRFRMELLSGDGDSISLRALSPLPSTEPTLRITLFQGLPKGEKMDWIVQKATELGVARVVPLRLSRCVVKLDAKEGTRKAERWQKIAREAGKQSGRCLLPEVTPPCSLADLSRLPDFPEVCCVPWEEAGHGGGPVAFARRHSEARSLGVVIGPEGGIAPEEIALLQEQFSCETITLGPRILRTETAAIAALSAFFTLYGEME